MRRVAEREAAKAVGDRFYYTGKRCQNGHLSKRYTGNGLCAECSIKNTLAWQKKGIEHPNRVAARLRGEKHYSVGEPCKYGHEDKRYVSTGLCFTCDVIRQKKWDAAHPGLEAEWARKRRNKDPSGHRKASLKWAKKNPAKVRAASKRCMAKNPDLWRKRFVAYVQNRKAKIAKNGGHFTDKDIDRLRRAQNNRCAACKREHKLQIDHIIAIASGGSGDPSNLQLLCGPCNKSKGRKDYDAWLKEQLFSPETRSL